MKNNFLIIFLWLNLLITVNVSVAQQKSNKKVVLKKTTTKETCCTAAIPNRLVNNSSNTNVSNSLKITDQKTHDGMVWIPGGIFSMGGDNDQARQDEFPKHQVKLNGFFIDITEVTNAQFAKFVAATGYVTTAEKDIDWDELKKQLPSFFVFPTKILTLVKYRFYYF